MNKISLPGAPAYYDESQIVEFTAGGVYLSNHPNHLVLVDTDDVLYGFISRNGQVEGKAVRCDGRVPLVLGEHTLGVRMEGYIGTGMPLEFSLGPVHVTTGNVICIRTAPLIEAPQ